MSRKLVILGGGESGVGAAILAKKNGYDVFLSDLGRISNKYRKELEDLNVGFEEEKHSFEKIASAPLVVKSPGIPDTAPVIEMINKKGAKVVSEIEFASLFTKSKLIGITGSNGKTTTARLIHHLLVTGGHDAALAGNVGDSFSRVLAQGDHKCFVLELSSFQLDGIDTFRASVAVLLNISPDHLDRYNYEMKRYAQSKFRIAANQDPDDHLVYNASDEWIEKLLNNLSHQGERISVFMPDEPNPRLVVDGFQYDLSASGLKGRHNQFNCECAVRVALLQGISPDKIQIGLDTFRNEEHRMEAVRIWKGVEYINDSKATNVDAVFYALEAMSKPVHWIVGGQDKGNDYSSLDELVKNKVESIICLGVDNDKILNHFTRVELLKYETNNALEAVRTAAAIAKAGDVVLLSPACASFDLFDNYKHRGDAFKKAVMELSD